MSKKQPKHIELSEITNPNVVKELNYNEIGIFAKDLRKYIIDSVAKNGGHLGSNLGTVDAIISLCRVFDFDKDKILFDVGHQSYAYKVLTGRKLDDLRQKGGISGFQKIEESKYDVFEAGHSSTSISAANGMAIARDLNKENYDIIAFIGDASIVNGLAFEGLNNASQGKHKIIIVLNDNNMSISRPIGGMGRFLKRISMNAAYNNAKRLYKRTLLKTRLGSKIYKFSFRLKNQIKHFLIPTTVFDNMGYKYIGPVNGHDIKSMDKAFKKAQKQKKSCVIHLRTIKGRGYKPAEEDRSGSWHGVAPFDVNTGKVINESNEKSWSRYYADLLHKYMGEDQKSILITPAMIYGSCLEDLFKDYHKRCFDVGISEEHAFTMASGIALQGYHPIISIYSTFLQRGYDEMLHDVARMNLNCTLLIDRSGLPGADGETHQGTFDESLIYSIPNTVISMAGNDEQANSLLKESFKFNKGLFAIRYPKANIMLTNNHEKEIGFGEWDLLKSCKKAKTCIVGVGPNVIRLCKLANEKDLNVDIFNAIYQKPFKEDYLEKLLTYKKIIIYQSYATKYGFALSLLEKLVKKGFKGQIILKTIPDEFIKQASINEQLEELKLRPEDIIKEI